MRLGGALGGRGGSNAGKGGANVSGTTDGAETAVPASDEEETETKRPDNENRTPRGWFPLNL